ncbi:hypothetical protein C7A12_06520 [Pseudomonas fluorescens]|uniref:Uncharacterized protein n=1 Tax=Pseudomonas fluorescens TaxID=294 RepID=A0A2T0I626_PSEFL|nr:hypothetical protein C7A12_06520 [Pseudomonas fluorescens]PRW79832.1 hypothetical protein C7A13_08990 [Pseudomonas fluorescens]PRW90780.1 hypothetical protein C7A10_17215 [Pseudomonas fluorescens]
MGRKAFVGASLLAKNSRAPRSSRKNALSLTFFASKLAPTDEPRWGLFIRPFAVPACVPGTHA